MISIHQQTAWATAAKHAGVYLAQKVLGWSPDPVLILFSGGSPLEIVRYMSPDGFDDRCTVAVSDERFSTDPLVNNLTQVMATDWWKKTSSKGVRFIDTRPLSGETVQEAGMRFDSALKDWKHTHPDGKIIITQGIGLDGHTAGMMPYPEDPESFNRLFVATDALAVGYDAKEKNKYPLRITTTVPCLQSVDESIVFVCGSEKQKPLDDVFAAKDNIATVPGRIIHSMKHCHLYTDLLVDRVNI